MPKIPQQNEFSWFVVEVKSLKFKEISKFRDFKSKEIGQKFNRESSVLFQAEAGVFSGQIGRFLYLSGQKFKNGCW